MLVNVAISHENYQLAKIQAKKFFLEKNQCVYKIANTNRYTELVAFTNINRFGHD
jgi:hypothetical protein